MGNLETLVPQMLEETLVFVDKMEKAAQDGSTMMMLDATGVMIFRLIPLNLQNLTFDIMGRFANTCELCLFG